MRCHYEVLEVPRDVNNDDLKKAYRKAALKWHPDKNIDNPDNAKEQFQLVQQAYEVLSDPHERAWFDAHRDAILKGGLGGDYKDDSLDVFPYFSTTCFKGYGDDEKGFYSVYREVFNQIAAEDTEFMEDRDSDCEIPEFGTSSSNFKEVVQPFYAYWQNYSTKRSFSWLDQYDIKDLPNRRIAKLAEKENKKLRDKARKDRNEQIRNLVAFVRKRDKRVRAHAELAKEQQAEKERLAEEKRKSKIRERLQQMKDYKESEWSKFSNFENELKNIEKSLKAEHGDHDSSAEEDEGTEFDNGDGSESEVEDFSALYCPACKKSFKSVKAFSNHENSKKHKENVEKLRQAMLEEEQSDEELEDEELSDEELSDEELEEEDLLDEVVDEEVEAEGDADEVENSDSSDENLNGAEATKMKNASSEDEDETGRAQSDAGSEDSDDLKSLSKSSKKKKKNKVTAVTSKESSGEEDDLSMLSKKQRRKLQQRKAINVKGECEVENTDETEAKASPVDGDAAAAAASVDNEEDQPKTKSKGKKAKEARKLKREAEASCNGTENMVKSSKKVNHVKVDPSVIDTEHTCATCTTTFNSKNKLFDHLKKTGHSIYLPNKKGSPEVVDDKKKPKGRRK